MFVTGIYVTTPIFVYSITTVHWFSEAGGHDLLSIAEQFVSPETKALKEIADVM